MHRISRSCALAIPMALLLAACASPPSSPARSGQISSDGSQPARISAPKRVVAGIPSTPPFLYNKINIGGVGGQGSALQDLVHVGLTAYDTRNVLHPRLAAAVPSLENGLWKLLPDGRMETTWHLRPNLRWHDSTQFTSADLAFTLTVVGDPELPVLSNAAKGLIESVSYDPGTLTVMWNRPFILADALFSADLAVPMPMHLLDRAYRESKSTLLEQPFWSTEFVGTGPFRVKEFERGSHLLVEAFDGFALGRPKVDQVEVRFVSDETTLVANLLAGSIDLTLARAISAEQGGQLRDQWKEGRIENSIDDWYIMYPQFIGANPPVVTDARFRRALMHGADRQQMADTLEGGLSTVVHAVVAPSEPEYPAIESSIAKYDFDPRRAVQIVEGLGYTRGSDGFFRDRSGQKLEVEINTTRLDAHQKLMFALKGDWERIGVGVETVVIPPQRAQDGEYRATFPGFALQGHPRDLTRFLSREARLPERSYTGGNNARYMNPELDGQIDRYFSTVPTRERYQLLAQIVAHISEQLVVLPLIWRVDPTALSNRLLNIGPKGPDATQAWNAHEWDVK